jgi:integrase
MGMPLHNSLALTPYRQGRKVARQANGAPSIKEWERMARRRFQKPTPFRRGAWWYLRLWRDEFVGGQPAKRRRAWIKLAPASMNEREVLKIADEHLRPINQGLETIGGATNFQHFVKNTYEPVVMPLMAKSTQNRYRGIIANYLLPAFGKLCLRDLTFGELQRYFSSQLNPAVLSHESRDKIRDVLSSILQSAIQHGLVVKNPCEGVRLPQERTGRRRNKPYVTPEQFDQLVIGIAEPYATMVYVAIYTGLRASELIGLKWNDVHADSITIDERCCRGDWGAPKSDASNATIAVNDCVVRRLERLKTLSVKVKWGGHGASKTIRLVRSSGPEDLVFQSLKKGAAMRDNNILSRHIKPAARAVGLGFVNWRCLRTSHATWLKLAGADVKDAQAQMRHARPGITLELYQQFVPESQKRVVDNLGRLVHFGQFALNLPKPAGSA